MKRKLPLALLPLAAGTLTVHAATLVDYQFSALTGARNDWTNIGSAYAAPSAWTGDPRTGNYLLSGSTEATATTGVIAGNINAAGTGLAYSTASPAPGQLVDGDLNLANWISSSSAGQDQVSGYITFSLGAVSGYSVTLESITFTGWRNGAGAPDTINFDYSLDGGTTWLDYSTAVVRSTSGVGTSASNTFSQNLEIAGGTSALFRFAPYRTDAGTDTGNWHITGLTLNGTVIPEPTSALLGALGALALLRRRRH